MFAPMAGVTTYDEPAAYELWMGRWSERLAPAFVRFVDPPPGSRILDIGTGTGVMAAAIVQQIERARVEGIEPAQSYIDHARRRLAGVNVSITRGDAQSLPYAAESFAVTVSLLVLQEMRDGDAALAEMCRVTSAGGYVAACQWDFRDGLPVLSMFWEAAAEILPGAVIAQEKAHRTNPGYTDAASLDALWQRAGLAAVEARCLDISMSFQSFDDYWAPFLGGATRTSSYAATLPCEVRDALRDRLRQRVLGDGPDRPFDLPARAWAVKGRCSSL